MEKMELALEEEAGAVVLEIVSGFRRRFRESRLLNFFWG